jgi:hypothetical protein
MSMDRRTFLKAAAAAPCIFGLRELFAQETETRPEWFRKALDRMKERKLHGVVVLAPEADPKQLEFGRTLWLFLEGDFPEAHELFLTGVFIFMTPAAAEASGIRKPDEKETRFLLDPDGKRIAADSCGPTVFTRVDEFTASFASFLYGSSDQRLKARADEQGASAAAGVHTALLDLGADELEARDKATHILAGRAADLIPFFAWKRRTATDPEVASRLKSIIERHFRSLADDAPGARLPFGTRIPKFANGGCGSRREVVENEPKDTGPMVACGMGRVDEPRIQMFLRFLAK